VTRSPLVVCTDLTHTYGRGVAAMPAVRGVSCAVAPADTIALSGPSGSGKSTLLHLLAGLVAPTAGRVEWPTLGPPANWRPGTVGVVFQEPSLMPALNVVENVALPQLLADTQEATAFAAAQESLDLLGIGELAAKLPEELSGGQAQRVAIARVLAGGPQLVLADEPTGKLDHDTGLRSVSALTRAAEELGAALVLATHDPVVADRLADRWWMRDGHLDFGRSEPPVHGLDAR
jgi:ABC-type lipoprotein export system ATPase subunit